LLQEPPSMVVWLFKELDLNDFAGEETQTVFSAMAQLHERVGIISAHSLLGILGVRAADFLTRVCECHDRWRKSMVRKLAQGLHP
jgi:hypothetical protein